MFTRDPALALAGVLGVELRAPRAGPPSAGRPDLAMSARSHEHRHHRRAVTHRRSGCVLNAAFAMLAARFDMRSNTTIPGPSEPQEARLGNSGCHAGGRGFESRRSRSTKALHDRAARRSGTARIIGRDPTRARLPRQHVFRTDQRCPALAVVDRALGGTWRRGGGGSPTTCAVPSRRAAPWSRSFCSWQSNATGMMPPDGRIASARWRT